MLFISMKFICNFYLIWWLLLNGTENRKNDFISCDLFFYLNVREIYEINEKLLTNRFCYFLKFIWG